MVQINIGRFSSHIAKYLGSPENFQQDAVVDTLNPVNPQSKWGERRGITFGHNTDLVMQLLARAYRALDAEVESADFSERVAAAVQKFAEPFPEQDNLCYPHFLFHGLIQPTLDAVVGRIEQNSQIIHETLRETDKIMAEHGRIKLSNGLQLVMDHGATDDYFGIAYLLAKEDERGISSASGYIAKASFFVDQTNKEIYVMTLQGKRFGAHDPVRASHPSGHAKKLEAEREYSRIGNILGMSPRRFILTKVMVFGRNNGFTKIKIIRPEEHPMAIEKYEGFYANYEPVIRKAGITEENGCYLECGL